MKKKLCAVLALFPALLLAGCGGQNAGAANAPAGAQPAAFSALQRNSGWNDGSGSENGFYYIGSDVRGDGSANLMYLDYATMQKVYLCSQPNCSHDTQACTSCLPYSAGGILPCVVGGHLVLVFPGNVGTAANGSVLPHIEQMELDGADRKTTLTFEANQQINRPLATDGTCLYCELDTATEDGNTKAELVRIDPAAGTVETLCALEQEWVKGGAGSKLFLLAADGSYVSYDPAADERETVVTAENVHIDSLLEGGTLAYKEDGYFCLLDLLSGEKTVLSGFDVPGAEETFVNLVDVDPAHLLVQVETASHQTGADLADGYYMVTGDAAPQKWELVYRSGEEDLPFRRAATLPDGRYLVVAGEEAAADVNAGSYYVPTGEKQYLQMEPEDFWNGVNPAAGAAQ